MPRKSTLAPLSLALVIFSTGAASLAAGEDEPVLVEAGKLLGVEPERLSIVHREMIELAGIGKRFELYKVADAATGAGLSIGIDEQGLLVDPSALMQQARDAQVERHGKLHPALASKLEAADAGTRIPVTIWLGGAPESPGLERPDPDSARALGAEGLRRLRVENLERVRASLRVVGRPLLDDLAGAGYRVEAVDFAPVIYAELPPDAIRGVERRADVLGIDIGAGARAHGDGGSGDLGIRLATARTASKSDIVEARGIDGDGIRVAVNEETAVTTVNPWLPPVAQWKTPAPGGGGVVHAHPTACSGFIASTHGTNRGVAPGVDQIFSGNFGTMVQNGGWATTADQAAGISWAVSNGVEVVSNSYGSFDDGQMHDTDRMMDWSVRNLYISIVNSAGNNGNTSDLVSSAALGYNVLSVGSIDDHDTADWADDTMSNYTSWLEPAGREKPDVSAVGCSSSAPFVGETSTTLSSPWLGNVGCGTSYSGPLVAGMAAALTQRDPGLGLWPEGVKAIAIASALHNVEGDPARSAIDGAGAIDMAAADSIAANGWWRGLQLDGTDFTAGRHHVATQWLQRGERIRAALAYDSNPSASYATDPLEGDLDLRLYDNNGAVIAVSAGLDSWEIFETSVAADGYYTLEVFNWADSLAPSEWTYAGVAWWPGHYRLDANLAWSRPGPTSAGDHYRFDSSIAPRWWVVGLRPAVGADYDLRLLDGSTFANPTGIEMLTSSVFGSSQVDLVAIDGHHAPPKNYYPVVETYSGSGTYSVQATSGTTISTGIETRTTNANWLAEIWDLNVVGGTAKWVALHRVSGDADLGLAVFDSDPANASSFYQRRLSAFAASDGPGTGDEAVIVSTPTTDRMGLVVYANPGQTQQTTWQLFVDDTAPSASMAINAGAIGTTSPSVTLSFSVADLQTGVAGMRFSSDGASWTPWEAYAASQPWTLYSTPGMQTVYAEFRNGAGQITPASDSIVLEDCANVDSVPRVVVRVGATGQELAWSMRPQLADVVYGDLGTLQSSGGNFALATAGCLEDDLFETWANIPSNPAVGQGYWYLVRPADCGGGSYDDGSAGQVQSSDPGILASGVACP
jgi:hypothetical protein